METATNTYPFGDVVEKTRDVAGIQSAGNEHVIGPQKEPWQVERDNAKWQRKQFVDSLVINKLPCLPDETGYADTRPVYRPLKEGYNHVDALNGLMVRNFLRQHNFKDNRVVTFEEAKKAAELCNPDAAKPGAIKYSERGMNIYNSVADPDNPGKFKTQLTRVFSAEQMVNPDNLNIYMRENNLFRNRVNKSPVAEIVADSSDPEKYLGQYYSACFLGAKFKASPEIAKEFQSKCMDVLVKIEPGKQEPSPWTLKTLSSKASEVSREFSKQFTQERNQNREQGQTQSVSSLAQKAALLNTRPKPKRNQDVGMSLG